MGVSVDPDGDGVTLIRLERELQHKARATACSTYSQRRKRVAAPVAGSPSRSH